VQACAELRLPLVDLNDEPPFAGVPKIRPDNAAIGHLGGEHFLERGYRNYGFTGFRNNGWSCERRDGFVEAVQLAGHAVDVFDTDYPNHNDPAWDLAQTRQLAKWLRQLPKPASVMACNDLRALQVIHAAQTVNLLVPEEVAVLGANNDEARCDLAYPPLSSVCTNAFLSGYLAAETLAALMDGAESPALDRRVDPTGVITRRSSDILAIEDPGVAAAIGYIREHACTGINVEDVLRHSTLSPQAEIRRLQIMRIKQLLTETDFPLKKIAELTGFEHVEYMCVVFKRITELSPGAFRDRRQSNRPSQRATG
jgi:LacI family transcriptional regulator